MRRAAVGDAIRSFKAKPEFMGVVILVIVVILNIITQQGKFFQASNFANIFANNTPLIILTMAQCMVLLSGNIDISTGITMSLVNVWCVMMPEYYPGFPVWLAFAVGFLLAVAVGFANGFLVGYFRVPPMLATYGMSYIVRGLSLIISDRPQGRIDKSIRMLYRADILGVPASFLIVVAFSLAWAYMKRRPGIKEIYALGGNEKNTYLTGVSTLRATIRAYVVCGVFTGFAGLLWTAMLSSSNPISGDVKTLESIAAALLGGTLISGGWGSMICGVLGAIFLALVTNTATYLFISLLPKLIPGFSLPNYYQNFVSQTIILLGIVTTIMAGNRTARRAAKHAGGVREGGQNAEDNG
jgi:ribose/xylose/arabinose/galactoside ABC-type transport system permease subunit